MKKKGHGITVSTVSQLLQLKTAVIVFHWSFNGEMKNLNLLKMCYTTILIKNHFLYIHYSFNKTKLSIYNSIRLYIKQTQS